MKDLSGVCLKKTRVSFMKFTNSVHFYLRSFLHQWFSPSNYYIFS